MNTVTHTPRWSLGVAVALPLLVLAAILHQQLLHFTTHLPDWRDYGLYLWILYQNIPDIQAGNWAHFFQGNIFYPATNTLFFSDLFLPQSFLGALLALFISNKIIVFNALFWLTMALNSLAITFFWQKLFKEPLTLIGVSFITNLWPYFFFQFGHWQMIGYWPLFLALAALVADKKTWRTGLWIGGWLALQFTASIYLSIFGVVVTGLYVLSTALHHSLLLITGERFKTLEPTWRTLLTMVAATAFVFVVVAGPFAYQYTVVQKTTKLPVSTTSM